MRLAGDRNSHTDDITDDISLRPEARGLVLEVGVRERSRDGRMQPGHPRLDQLLRSGGRGPCSSVGGCGEEVVLPETPRVLLNCQGWSRRLTTWGRRTSRASEAPPAPPPL